MCEHAPDALTSRRGIGESRQLPVHVWQAQTKSTGRMVEAEMEHAGNLENIRQVESTPPYAMPVQPPLP